MIIRLTIFLFSIVFSSFYLSAAEIYVTPSGAGVKDGSSWENAFDNLQAAVDAADSGDIIYLKEGVFTNGIFASGESHCSIADKSNLAILGGYRGIGTPGVVDGRSELLNLSPYKKRLFYAKNATLSINNLSFAAGNLGEGRHGGGLRLENCVAAMTNCIVRNCFVSGGGVSQSVTYGGGIYATGGSLDFVDGLIVSNSILGYMHYHGGGVYLGNEISATFAGTKFYRNYNKLTQGGSGGALACFSSDLFVRNCTFEENFLINGNYGAAINVTDDSRLSKVEISDSYFLGNCHAFASATTPSLGGCIYMSGSKLEATVCRTVFVDGKPSNSFYPLATAPYNGDYASGAFQFASGALSMTNVLFARGASRATHFTSGGNSKLYNCTLTEAGGSAVTVIGGTVIIDSSIIWGNGDGVKQNGGTIEVNNSVTDEAMASLGGNNLVADPLFSSDGYCHPRSMAGYYMGGFFDGGWWNRDSAGTSPSIDYGTRASLFSAEPQPNGNRANIGYDANTDVASKSYLGEPAIVNGFAVYALPATDIGADSATVGGVVANNDENERTSVTLVWDNVDRGVASTDSWSNSLELGEFGAWEYFTTQIESCGNVTYYRVVGQNPDGEISWSNPVRSFNSASPPRLAKAFVSHVSRHNATINGELLENGGIATDIRIYYREDTASESKHVELVDSAIGQFNVKISNLSPNTLYHIEIVGKNDAGSVSQSFSFTTLTTEPIACYVTPEGAGIKDGSSWDNAFGNLQDALDICFYKGDVVYMKKGVYTANQQNYNEISHYVITNAAGLLVVGGYEGVGAPGNRTDQETILRRPSSSTLKWRILRGNNSTFAFDGVAFEGGEITAANTHGCVLRLQACNVALTNCIIRNGVYRQSWQSNYGIGLYAQNGALTMVDCVVSNNAGSGNAAQLGAGLYLNGVNSSISNTLFSRNRLNVNWGAGGGAIYAIGGTISIDKGAFMTNAVIESPSTSATGSAIYISSTKASIDNSMFFGNLCYRNGGTVVLNSTHKTVIRRCVMSDNNYIPWGNTYNNNNAFGGILNNAGNLAVTNLLMAHNAGSTRGAIAVMGGTADIVNVTLVDNPYSGITAGGTAIVKVLNSIIWGNGVCGIEDKTSSGNGYSVSYSISQESHIGDGVVVKDPVFVDNTYYHLFSAKGYAVGYFGGGWSTARPRPGIGRGSPGIDAGAPSFGTLDEPMPAGHRLNLGAYGGTEWASLSPGLPSLFIIR